MAARNKPARIRSLVYGMSKGKAGIEGLSVSAGRFERGPGGLSLELLLLLERLRDLRSVGGRHRSLQLLSPLSTSIVPFK